jgi:23S rRNA pseudouridine1911/1915/1917 synthase
MKVQLTNEVAERLDKMLVDVLGKTRSAIQKIIKNGHVEVNGETAAVKTLVSTNDDIVIEDDALEDQVRSTDAPPLDILFENDEMLALNKPAGLLVHHAPGNLNATLADALMREYPEIVEVGDDAERPGIVHRLDKHASGVLVVAKTQAAFEHLKKQFKDRLTKKEYLVLVEGQLPDLSGTIDFPIERSKTSGRMAAKPLSQGGKEATTHYETIKQYPHHTYLRVNIETGRTHQIRVHLYSLEHPVVGDTLYRQKGKSPMDIGRLFLHAHELTINCPDGETRVFTAPLPAELEQVLEDIPKL